MLLRPLPFPEPERLVLVYETDRARGTRAEGASAPDFADWLAETRSFEHLAAIRFENQVLTSGDGVLSYSVSQRRRLLPPRAARLVGRSGRNAAPRLILVS
ncbi:MAG: hypothetical protein VYE73_05830 [Acidobacteriota bacterium]|nr:hypothetical protein [Acidobacteriota bacterium]